LRPWKLVTLAATPGRPYARGFLRSYAEHLGMDADRLEVVSRTLVGRQPFGIRQA
jgi:cytoskeletal protein RodZ